MKYALISGSILLFICFVLWSVRPRSPLHAMLFAGDLTGTKVLCVSLCIATILLCILPMSLSPIWSGKIPTYRNQYELMADSILDGRLYFDYEVDEKLLEMENPYDTEAREALDVDYHWDHAFYNGKYWMYFGIVPEFLLFIPFKLLTGISLPAYHATQIFTAGFIIGFFLLFAFLAKRFFPHMTKALYLLGSISFSIVSIWLTVPGPAMYCTAISGALCLEIWSLFLFLKAVYDAPSEKKALVMAHLGALCGALSFGCRPPVALGNMILLPLIFAFLKNGRSGKHTLRKFAVIALPYAIVGALLMLYNYVRFDNPFEFGQSYQLTVTDQSAYGNFFAQVDIGNIGEFLWFYLFNIPFSLDAPSFGIFVTCPILLVSGFMLFDKGTRQFLKERRIFPLIPAAIAGALFIIAFDATASPWPLPRYHLDFDWLISIAAFLLIAAGGELVVEKDRKKYSVLVSVLCCVSVLACTLMFFIPYDRNFMDYYAPESVEIFKKIISFGLL